MPLFGRGNGKGVDYKSRLEHKLYLARENPDLVFDLSDCDLRAVPSGIYSLCKVFRKEALLLQVNNLTSLSGGGHFEDLSLLKIIDLRSNNLTTLTSDIRHLKNLEALKFANKPGIRAAERRLVPPSTEKTSSNDKISCKIKEKELYLNNNLLKCLPEGVGELSRLRILSLSFNRVKRLSEAVGRLANLRELYLQGNPALCHLPDSLARAANLRRLVIDVGRYVHPPNDTVLAGTREVLRYLAKQLGEEYRGVLEDEEATPATCERREDEVGGMSSPRDEDLTLLQLKDMELQEKLLRMEKRKEEKVKERLAVEKGIAEQKEKEFQLHNIIKVGKDKLMEDLMKQQSKIAEEVVRFQNRKEAERVKLIEELQRVEKCADEVIDQMLNMNMLAREPSRVLQQEELDRIAQEQLFAKHSEELRRKEVINAMESLLAEERLQREKLREYEQQKAEVVKNTLNRDVEWDEEMNALVCCRNAQQSAVMAAVTADERAQMGAVATLLERSDVESCRLRAQLQLIEQQLAALTALELQRNNLNVHQLQCDLSEKRTALSNLLVEVLTQQNDRKKHLLQTLRKMEQHRLEEFEEEDEDYWLRQYQKLLDSSPRGLLQQQGLDTRLVHHMVTHGVVHCLPFLARSTLDRLSNDYLLQVGLTNEEDRTNVLKAVLAYLDDAAVSAQERAVLPTAPPAENLPSAPPVSPTAECVVCMHLKCDVIFVPCGHLCCCGPCSNQLADCPLCRHPLERKIRIIPA